VEHEVFIAKDQKFIIKEMLEEYKGVFWFF